MEIVPSPCLMINQTVPIRVALDKMNENGTSYVLLKDMEGQLSGIFTERDLLKNFAKIVEGDMWEYAISYIMNRTIKSLPIGLIQRAPEFMRTHNIRHVPITRLNEESQTDQVVGIVTADAIFNYMVRTRGKPPVFGGESLNKKRKTVGITSPDGSLWHLLKKVYEESVSISVERFRFAELNNHEKLEKASEHCDALILDLDDAPNRFWIPAVTFFAKHKGIEVVAIVLDESKHKETLQSLQDLEKQGAFHIYKKPLDITRLTLDLEKFWTPPKM